MCRRELAKSAKNCIIKYHKIHKFTFLSLLPRSHRNNKWDGAINKNKIMLWTCWKNSKYRKKKQQQFVVNRLLLIDCAILRWVCVSGVKEGRRLCWSTQLAGHWEQLAAPWQNRLTKLTKRMEMFESMEMKTMKNSENPENLSKLKLQLEVQIGGQTKAQAVDQLAWCACLVVACNPHTHTHTYTGKTINYN